MNLKKKKMLKAKKEPVITIPLSALRCISSHPKDKKILCEINVLEMKRINEAGTFDEIINEARLDYAKGDYKTFTNSKNLLKYLKH